MTLSPRCWWALWYGFALAWTAGLLTVYPLAARDAVFSEETGFSVGKTLHVTAYFLFSMLTSRLPLEPRQRRYFLLAIYLHAPLTEYLQQFVGRTTSLADVGLDWAGITLGVLLTWKQWRNRRDAGPIKERMTADGTGSSR